MPDELTIQPQVQQKQSSPMPYVVGGAIGGGLVGGATAYYTTKPKYASHEDIIKDSKDNFEKAAKEVISEEAEQTKAINAYESAKKAETDYNAKLKAFVDSHKEGATPELPADNELIKQKAQLSETIKNLESKEGSAPKTKEPMAQVRQKLKQMRKANEELVTLQQNNAPKEAIANARENVKKLETQLDGIYDKIVENTKFKDTKIVNGTEVRVADSEIAKMKEALKKELKGYGQDYMSAYDRFSVKQPANAYLKAKSGIATEEQVIKDSLAKIKETTGYEVESSYNKSKKDFARRTKTIFNVEKKKTADLHKILVGLDKASSTTNTSTFWQRLGWLLTGSEIPNQTSEQAVKDFISNLSDREKALLQGKDVSKDTIKQLIKESEDRTKLIKSAVQDMGNAEKALIKYKKNLEAEKSAIKKKFGPEAYINEEGVVCKKGKPIQKAPQFNAPEFKPSTELPKEVAFSEGAMTNAEKASLDKAKSDLKALETKIADARNALPKSEAMTEDAAKALFEKENGTLKDAVGKAFGEDVKALLEKKIPNKKLAAYIGGGAAILAALGYMIAPKHSEDIA